MTPLGMGLMASFGQRAYRPEEGHGMGARSDASSGFDARAQQAALSAAFPATPTPPPATNEKEEWQVLNGMVAAARIDRMPWQNTDEEISLADRGRAEWMVSQIQRLPFSPRLGKKVLAALEAISRKYDVNEYKKELLTGLPKALPAVLTEKGFHPSFVAAVRSLVSRQELRKMAADPALMQKPNRENKSAGRKGSLKAALALLAASPVLATPTAPEKPEVGVLIPTTPAAQPDVKAAKPALWGDINTKPLAFSFVFSEHDQLHPVAQLTREDGKWVTVNPDAKDLAHRIDPASMTKLLSFALVMDRADRGETLDGQDFRLDTMVRLTDRQKKLMVFDAWQPWGRTPRPELVKAIMSMKEISVRDLLRFAMTNSNNGAIWAAALAAAGFKATGDAQVDLENEEKFTKMFVAVMNEMAARKMGMTDSHFENVTGLPPYEDELEANGAKSDKKNRAALKNNVSTPMDIARAMAWLGKTYSPEVLAQFLELPAFTLPGTEQTVKSSNPILKDNPLFAAQFNQFANKTATTDLAGANNIGLFAPRPGYKVITVTVGYSRPDGNRCPHTMHLVQAAVKEQEGLLLPYEAHGKCFKINSGRQMPNGSIDWNYYQPAPANS